MMYEGVRIVNENLRRQLCYRFSTVLVRRHHQRHAHLFQRALRLPPMAGEEAAMLPHAPVERDRGVAITDAELLRRVVEVAVEPFCLPADGLPQPSVHRRATQRA